MEDFSMVGGFSWIVTLTVAVATMVVLGMLQHSSYRNYLGRPTKRFEDKVHGYVANGFAVILWSLLLAERGEPLANAICGDAKTGLLVLATFAAVLILLAVSFVARWALYALAVKVDDAHLTIIDHRHSKSLEF